MYCVLNGLRLVSNTNKVMVHPMLVAVGHSIGFRHRFTHEKSPVTLSLRPHFYCKCFDHRMHDGDAVNGRINLITETWSCR